MKKRYKIDSYKVPQYENQRVVSFVDLLEEKNTDKKDILVYIDSLQIQASVPCSNIIDTLLNDMEEHWSDFYDTFKERSEYADDEECARHADYMIKDIYSKEYEILKKDYPDKYKD
jgi:hypothetical protein